MLCERCVVLDTEVTVLPGMAATMKRFLTRLTGVEEWDGIYPALSDGVALYCIGDVHGRLDCLVAVHAAIDRDLRTRPGVRAREIYLGDYVDRGPQSRGVVDALIARSARRDCVFLSGNHETALLDVISGAQDYKSWALLGGANTVLSYGGDPRAFSHAGKHAGAMLGDLIPDEHLDFFESLAPSYRHESYFFAHAGVRPGVPLDRQSRDDLTRIRDVFLTSREDHGAVVVHGHTPRSEIEFRSNRINLDIGAYATGRLACARIDRNGVGVVSPPRPRMQRSAPDAGLHAPLR